MSLAPRRAAIERLLETAGLAGAAGVGAAGFGGAGGLGLGGVAGAAVLAGAGFAEVAGAVATVGGAAGVWGFFSSAACVSEALRKMAVMI